MSGGIHMHIGKTIPALALAIIATPSVSFAQNSLVDQQERCDRLREEVDDARQELNRQRAISDGQRQVDEAATAYMAAKGRSQAMIDQAQRLRSMGRSWNGSESNASRSYETAMERYSLQGCSTGGRSTYSYEPK